ncbi:hypothetical protein C8F01DRAFT_1089828 [Mycena amicta]|nr:hypothetical protein C8F01DRAFT_1089828 [Mycena amicta]
MSSQTPRARKSLTGCRIHGFDGGAILDQGLERRVRLVVAEDNCAKIQRRVPVSSSYDGDQRAGKPPLPEPPLKSKRANTTEGSGAAGLRRSIPCSRLSSPAKFEFKPGPASTTSQASGAFVPNAPASNGRNDKGAPGPRQERRPASFRFGNEPIPRWFWARGAFIAPFLPLAIHIDVLGSAPIPYTLHLGVTVHAFSIARAISFAIAIAFIPAQDTLLNCLGLKSKKKKTEFSPTDSVVDKIIWSAFTLAYSSDYYLNFVWSIVHSKRQPGQSQGSYRVARTFDDYRRHTWIPEPIHLSPTNPLDANTKLSNDNDDDDSASRMPSRTNGRIFDTYEGIISDEELGGRAVDQVCDVPISLDHLGTMPRPSKTHFVFPTPSNVSAPSYPTATSASSTSVPLRHRSRVFTGSCKVNDTLVQSLDRYIVRNRQDEWDEYVNPSTKSSLGFPVYWYDTVHLPPGSRNSGERLEHVDNLKQYPPGGKREGVRINNSSALALATWSYVHTNANQSPNPAGINVAATQVDRNKKSLVTAEDAEGSQIFWGLQIGQGTHKEAINASQETIANVPQQREFCDKLIWGDLSRGNISWDIPSIVPDVKGKVTYQRMTRSGHILRNVYNRLRFPRYIPRPQTPRSSDPQQQDAQHRF